MYKRFLAGERSDDFARRDGDGRAGQARGGGRSRGAVRSIGRFMPPSASHSPLSPLSALLHAGAVWGERPAVRWDDWAVTYRELLDRCARVAGGARAHAACAPGDRVAAILPNVPELLELHFAVPAAGAVLVPMNVRMTGAELAYILEHSGAARPGGAPEPRRRRRRGRRRARRSAAGDHDPGASADDGSEYEERLAAAAPRRDHAARRRDRAALDQLHERHHRAGRRASCTPTAAPTCTRWASSPRRASTRAPPTCGRCRCSTATAGRSPGR